METTLAAVLALAAAVAWGSGDFSGGLAARRVGPYHAVLSAYIVGLVVLVIVAIARAEPIPVPADLAWGAIAGVLGTFGLVFLLRGFAIGQMGIVAPVSAVLAAAIPVVVAAFTEGLPRELQLAGFALAPASIWLLSRPESSRTRPVGLGLALLAGIGFGTFFTALGQVGENAVFWPLVACRVAGCVLMAFFALVPGRRSVPPLSSLGLLMLVGILNVGGDLFFLLAVQSGRLDIASVLGSLYPAVTAVLAWVIAKEHMGRLQLAGLALAILAIVLITV